MNIVTLYPPFPGVGAGKPLTVNPAFLACAQVSRVKMSVQYAIAGIVVLHVTYVSSRGT